MAFCECGCGEETSIATRTDNRRFQIKGEPLRFIHGHNNRGGTNQTESLNKIARLIQDSGIDLDEIARVDKVNVYQGYYKDNEGNAQTVDLASVHLTPTWADGPEWPVVQPANPSIINYGYRPVPKREAYTTIILPDPQIGYWRLSDGTMIPTHDEKAIEVALAIIAEIRPNAIVNLGDFLDLSEWSLKFAVYPEFVGTTQAAVDYGHAFLARQIAAADMSVGSIHAPRNYVLEGNHDDRIPRLISANAKAAMRLRRADEPEGWPVMSVPNLLSLDSLGVEYVSGYPAGRLKLASAHGRQTALYALHGEKLDMQKQSRTERQSTVQGHTHHVSMHTEVYNVDGEPVEVESHSLGCLCAIDGRVPSTKGAPDLFGRPVVRHESWSQAVGILTETDNAWSLEPVRIRDGVANLRGDEINWRDANV